MRMIVPLFFVLGLIEAHAYETDQLTHRNIPLADAAPVADARMDSLLSIAIADTNEKTRCDLPEKRTHRVLVKKIVAQISPTTPVPERGGLKAMGFRTYAAYLESTDEVERRDFRDRDDIFSDATAWHSVILSTVGPSSTLNIAGYAVGTDKLDHYLWFGYRGYRHSKRGRHPQRAERWSARTERGFYGLITSKTFSFADVAANADGYSFYLGLLGGDSVITLDDDGCVTQTRPWHWSDWVDWRYDEAMNPPVHTPLVQRAIDRRIDRELEVYCLAYRALGGTEYDAHIARLLAEPRRRGHPVRTDPFRLGERCSEPAAGDED